MSEAILCAEGVRKTYHDGTRDLAILQGVTFSVHEGESVAIIGRSGTGKSTLLNCLGLLDRPTGGAIRLSQYPVNDLSDRQRTVLRGRAIGFVFQQHHLLADFTALENVIVAGHFAAKHPGLARARELIERVGLGERFGHKPAKLSGGEQQRVALARALYTNPAILLCDEPTGNLDPHTGAEVMEILWGLVKQQGKAMVLVTHDQQIAARADRVLCLEDGFVREVSL